MRKMNIYRKLFEKYDELDNKQNFLYEGKVILPSEKKDEYNKLQVKKLAILEEMEQCL